VIRKDYKGELTHLYNVKILKRFKRVIMGDDKENITLKLINLVKKRETPVVVSKQSNNYGKIRKNSSSLSSSGFAFDNDE